MKNNNFLKNVLLIVIIGLALYTVAFHVKYSHENVKMDDLMKVEALAPNTANQNLIRTLKKAVVHDLNYLNQAIYYTLFKGKTVITVSKLRIIDGLIAAIAVLLIYRIATLCCGRLTAIISASFLALTPPDLWGEHALRISVVLLNFSFLIGAIKKDTVFNWALWIIATVLLFFTGVFAEPIFLQSWFIAIILIFLIWSLMSKTLPEWKRFIRIIKDSKRKRVKSLWKQVQGDAGFSRYIATAIIVGIISLVLSFTGSFFISSSILSIDTLAFIVLLSFCIVLIIAVILLALPMFQRERSLILDWITTYKNVKYSKLPCETFLTIKSGGLLKVIFSYSIAMLLFIPMFFIFYKDINIFINSFELNDFYDFITSSPDKYYLWLMVLLPLIFILLTCTAYMLKVVSRGRFIGAVILFIPANIYIFQQRYSVISTPFYIICSAGIAALIIEIIVFFITNKRADIKNA